MWISIFLCIRSCYLYKDNFTSSFPSQTLSKPFISFSCLLALTRNCNAILNCLVPHFRKNFQVVTIKYERQDSEIKKNVSRKKRETLNNTLNSFYNYTIVRRELTYGKLLVHVCVLVAQLPSNSKIFSK